MNKLYFLKPVGFLVIVAGFGAVVMALWNWLMPAIFGLGAISFWQALGVLILSKLLFGSFRFGHGKHGGWKHGDNPVHDKWMKMTPEQRHEFISKRKERFGRGGFFGGRQFDLDAEENMPKNHE